LILFAGNRNLDSCFGDLYGVEFELEPSFLRACSGLSDGNHNRPWFLKRDPLPFLDLGSGWCAKMIDQKFDHPLTKRGVTIGKRIMIGAKSLFLLVTVFISLPTEHIPTLTARLTALIDRDTAVALDYNSNLVWDGKFSQLSLIDLYTFMVSGWTDSERTDANGQPLKFLVPLLELSLNRFEALASLYYERLLSEREDASAEVFASIWRPLRDTMVTAKLLPDAFKQYDSCHANGAIQKSSKVQYMLRRFIYLHESVAQLEQHMRDDQQLEVGHLSLQESKESIKQSKAALEESKRVKMRKFTVPGYKNKAVLNPRFVVTMLAFVFIPISLATSIFGMNIQELNSTGQPIWGFVVTAVATLAAAFWTWATFYQCMKYIHAPRSNAKNKSWDNEEKLGISLQARLKLLYWLIAHGHVVWCWRSGIIFSLLTCGRLGFTMTCQFDATETNCACPELTHPRDWKGMNGGFQEWISTHSPHAPCAYIQAHQDHPSRTGFSFAPTD
jgi:hypothetical protein